MEIPEKTLATVKNVVFGILDKGVVKDVSLRRDTDFHGEECLRVRLYVGAGTSLKDLDYRLGAVKFRLHLLMLKGELERFTPYIEVRAIAESDESTSDSSVSRDFAQSTARSGHLPADIHSEVESQNLRWQMYEFLTETLGAGHGINIDLRGGSIEISIVDGIEIRDTNY